jgi:hypothetical protein
VQTNDHVAAGESALPGGIADAGVAQAGGNAE